jgi:ATP-dependent DNA helicase RecG
MIDTMGYGIQRMFAEQRKRFFPLPDYDLSQPDQVRLVIHGKLLDENYSRILISQAELPLHLVMALDRVQKKLPIPDERIAELRRLKLVEGRKPNLFPASKLAAVAGSKAEYVRFRAFDDAHYKDMIQQYIVEFSSASRSDIDRLLQDKLSDSLDPDQKRHKIQNLLAAMKKEGIIARSGPKQTAVWKLEHPGPPIPLKNS